MHSYMLYPKLRDALAQKYFLLLLMVSFLCLFEVGEAEKTPRTACGDNLAEVLKTICLNGYNTKDLDGPIRYRRQSDFYMPNYIYRKQFFTPKYKLLKHTPSLKQVLKMEARWQQQYQVHGKRVRRQDENDSAERIKKGIVDDCCAKGCPYSTIEKYCKELDKQ